MFKQSAKNLRSTRYLAIMAIFIALKVAQSGFFLPVGENLRISFGYLLISVEACIIGPIPALVSGFVTDIIGFIVFPSGAFFPGYTLSAMLNCFIFAIFLYQTRITIFKLFTARLLINVLINATLGSLWTSMLYSKGFTYYFSVSIMKNMMLLPLEVFLLILVFKLVIPTLEKKNFIPKQSSNLPLI